VFSRVSKKVVQSLYVFFKRCSDLNTVVFLTLLLLIKVCTTASRRRQKLLTASRTCLTARKIQQGEKYCLLDRMRNNYPMWSRRCKSTLLACVVREVNYSAYLASAQISKRLSAQQCFSSALLKSYNLDCYTLSKNFRFLV